MALVSSSLAGRGIMLGGSRALVESAQVVPVVRELLAAGCSLSVGCASGADALCVSAALAAPGGVRALRVFAVGSQSGAGFWSCSAFGLVRQAQARGCPVAWCAGGPLSLPLRARLLRRSLAALAGCAAAVFFQPGPGSLAVAAAAVEKGQQVFAFSASVPALVPGAAGAWRPCSFCGLSAWFWCSYQTSLF